jgi:hypothetical protein
LLQGVPSAGSSGPRPEINRNDARVFALSVGNDTTLDDVSARLELDPYGGEAFLRAASEFLANVRDGKEVQIHSEDLREKAEFGILFPFVLQKLVELSENDRARYWEPFPPD